MRNLKFSYTEDHPIFENFQLSLDQRPTAIIGQNGAGKTTLVRLLKGLLKPSAGTILYQGEDISRRTVASLAGQVGYVFQNPDDQIFKYKVIDEVMFGPLNIGMPKEKAMEKAMEALALTELTPYAGENPYDLELSQRKLVAIASVLAMDTDVLFWTNRRLHRITEEKRLYGTLLPVFPSRENWYWRFFMIWIL